MDLHFGSRCQRAAVRAEIQVVQPGPLRCASGAPGGGVSVEAGRSLVLRGESKGVDGKRSRAGRSGSRPVGAGAGRCAMPAMTGAATRRGDQPGAASEQRARPAAVEWSVARRSGMYTSHVLFSVPCILDYTRGAVWT